MDFSLLFDPEYLPIILGTLVGFGLLAAFLLVPVYRFLEREQEVAEKWTPEALAERVRERDKSATNGKKGDGTTSSAPRPDRASGASSQGTD